MFSDLHSRAETLDVTMRCVAGMREETIALGVKEAAFLGDWAHVRGLLPVNVQNAWVDEFDRWAAAGLTMIVLTGNHDQVDVQGRHALEALRSHPAVKLYEQPTIDRWGLWIPYRHDLEVVRGVIASTISPTGVLFWHGSMLGARMNDHVFSERGLTVDDLAPFKLACLGHFHMRQQFGPAYYVGSPWETRADEAGQAKGFAVLDLAAPSLTYHDRAWGPRHVNLRGSGEEVAIALANASPTDKVRITVPEAEVEGVAKALAGRFAEFSVSPEKVDTTSARLLPGQGLTLRDHAARYVGATAGDLDPAQLMARFSEYAQ